MQLLKIVQFSNTRCHVLNVETNTYLCEPKCHFQGNHPVYHYKTIKAPSDMYNAVVKRKSKGMCQECKNILKRYLQDNKGDK